MQSSDEGVTVTSAGLYRWDAECQHIIAARELEVLVMARRVHRTYCRACRRKAAEYKAGQGVQFRKGA